jgi:P-type Ca2+ transporter type 2C
MKFSFEGLTATQVQSSREIHGSNGITANDTESFMDKLIGNLRDPIIIILLVALLITVVLWIFGYAEWYESVGIALAVILATWVAAWSEHSNEQSFQRLLAEASQIRVKVFRAGQLTEILIDELVVGDYILLQPGDTVPVDGLIVAGHGEFDAAALTGESEPVKIKAITENTPEPAYEDHTVYRASLVIDGEIVIRTTAVGEKTQYGQTMKAIVSAEDRLSPLQVKLSVLGQHIAKFGYFGATFIFLAFMFNKIAVQSDVNIYFAQSLGIIISDFVTAAILAIIIIVVAVPEGLPMMIAMVLALNMKKLLREKVLVRKLLGIETAGSLNILFTDKTGTLTQGSLSVSQFVAGSGQNFAQLNDIPEKVRTMLTFALRNNTSAVIDTSDPKNPKFVGADRTEQALLRFIQPYLAQDDGIEIVDMIQFNSARKFSATQVTGASNLTLVKGAPEVVLHNCTHYLDIEGNRQVLTEQDYLHSEMDALSNRAMRLLAIAVSETSIHEDQNLPKNLILLGIFAMRDELRATSYQSVQSAKGAGIHVIMITGDAKATAQAIARDVGLLENDDQAVVLTSAELAKLSDEQVKAILPHLYVVARAFPTDKSRLVRLAKSLGLVVGMTGDGVNDAPAVKNADVGFAMGSGTEMTKEASDIVILDDNFSSLNKSVLYGRTLFKSIRKFLIFQLTANVSAVTVVFLGPFFGFDLPLTMTQLLWLNIIMDTFAGLAFAGEAALQRYLQENPIPRDEPLISMDMWSSILLNGFVVAAVSIVFLTSDFTQQLFSGGYELGSHEAEAKFLTAFFAFFVFIHIFNTFNARTEGLNLFANLFANRLFSIIIPAIMIIQVIFISYGGDILRTVGLSLEEWLYVLAMALILIPVDLARKVIRNLLFT